MPVIYVAIQLVALAVICEVFWEIARRLNARFNKRFSSESWRTLNRRHKAPTMALLILIVLALDFSVFGLIYVVPIVNTAPGFVATFVIIVVTSWDSRPWGKMWTRVHQPHPTT